MVKDEFEKRVAEIHRQELKATLWRGVTLIVLVAVVFYVLY